MDGHSLEKKVYYHDTDCGGVVYYARYLEFLEDARTEFCLSKGVDLGEWFSKGVSFVVVRIELDYKSPARYAEKLNVRTSIEKLGDSSVHFIQHINRAGTLLVAARIIWACVGSDFKSRPIPSEIRKNLS